MKKILFALVLIQIISCLSPEQKQENLKIKVKPILEKYINSLNDGHIDSLIIKNIDTLTSEKNEIEKVAQYKFIRSSIDEDANKLVKEMTYYERLLDIQYDKYAANSWKDKREEAKLLLDKVNENDSLTNDAIEKSKIAPKNDFLGYIVLFRIKISDTTTGVQNKFDKCEVLLTKDFRVTERKSLLKNN